ncbi:MAG: DEAD/DEAH box helicase family protein [Bacteroidetes bacterium]|nr:DEAD/DEAH box helicase family protein [Bacteroidota bacterium]MBU2636594.1 DEAD/DEAH box helicase family protein [Bacteroidota bacterium]
MEKPLNTIIDNRNDNTVLNVLKRLLPESQHLDVATGYFEIGSFLSLDSFWNQLEKIRIVMGDETTKRTRNELINALTKASEESIEKEKEKDDSLTGLAAVREALIKKQIEAKIYRQAKFHAKAYLMQAKPPSPVNFGIVGSSNFTEPGLTKNLELNLFTTDQLQLKALQEWFDKAWYESEEVREELLKVIEPHLKLYTPFEVYAKALYEYYLGKEMPTSSWEETESTIYPILDDLQRIGYKQALYIAEQWGGALICDGVGFGKTYIGLMLIERFLHERKRVAIVVPKSARESVWEVRLRQFFKYQRGNRFGTQILIVNHTDLPRENPEIQETLENIREEADVIIVDEGHHFRTPNAQRSQKLYDMVEFGGKSKKIFFITATPVNNSLFDILHLMEYFTRKQRAYFQKLGINDTRSYFVKKERAVEMKMGVQAGVEDDEVLFPEFDIAEAERVLREDVLFRTLVIQRSREYAKQYFQRIGNGQILFPVRDVPKVASYKLANVYRELFPKIKQSFSKETPFLELTLYNPENNRRDANLIDPKTSNRECQVLGLIRATMLKRMESSYKAFEASCEDMLRNMARFLRYHSPEQWETWKATNADFWNIIETHWKERFQDYEEVEDVEEDDILPEPKQKLSGDEFFLDKIIESVQRDMAELAIFLKYIHDRLKEETDAKLQALVELLDSDDELRSKKVIIFTQYRDTARYLYRQIKGKIEGEVEELDSTSKKNRETIIKRFSPYYNCTVEELPQYLSQPIRVLISTDILSEGLNLQDANLLINYDLHWNPVRLMQRIGRVDRRLDPDIERNLGRDNHHVRYWNFLPPDELDSLLNLYHRVSGKLLRISKTLGIEGKKVLSPEDDFEALRDFNAQYDGVMPFEEKMRLMLVDILKNYPALKDELPRFPKRVFSGKQNGEPTWKGVFAAYRYPAREVRDDQGITKTIPGECKWYFHRFDSDDVFEDIEAIYAAIECTADTPRIVQHPISELRNSLKLIEQKKVHIELRNMQALAGEKATLVCWMEVV